jgi:hypothetical protein
MISGQHVITNEQDLQRICRLSYVAKSVNQTMKQLLNVDPVMLSMSNAPIREDTFIVW